MDETDCAAQLQAARAEVEALEQNKLVDGNRIRVLAAEVEALRGITPELPPYPPTGEGMPRYGLRWNGPEQPLAVPMADGYWTPWHLAEARATQAEEARDSFAEMIPGLRKAYNEQALALSQAEQALADLCGCLYRSVDGDVRVAHECESHKMQRERYNSALERERSLRQQVATLEDGKAAFFRDIYTPEREAWAERAAEAEATLATERTARQQAEAAVARLTELLREVRPRLERAAEEASYHGSQYGYELLKRFDATLTPGAPR